MLKVLDWKDKIETKVRKCGCLRLVGGGGGGG